MWNKCSWVWSFSPCVCLSPVSDVTNAALSVGLSCFRKILIIPPPSLLALALIDWQTSAGTEPARWLKWRNKTETRAKQNRLIKFINVKARLPPLLLYKSQRLVPLVYRLLSHSSLSRCSLASLPHSGPSISALWVMRDPIWRSVFGTTHCKENCVELYCTMRMAVLFKAALGRLYMLKADRTELQPGTNSAPSALFTQVRLAVRPGDDPPELRGRVLTVTVPTCCYSVLHNCHVHLACVKGSWVELRLREMSVMMQVCVHRSNCWAY